MGYSKISQSAISSSSSIAFAFPAGFWGSSFLLGFLCVCDLCLFLSNHGGSHSLSVQMVYSGCIFFVACIHLLGHECQDLLSLCNGVYALTR